MSTDYKKSMFAANNSISINNAHIIRYRKEENQRRSWCTHKLPLFLTKTFIELKLESIRQKYFSSLVNSFALVRR